MQWIDYTLLGTVLITGAGHVISLRILYERLTGRINSLNHRVESLCEEKRELSRRLYNGIEIRVQELEKGLARMQGKDT